MKKPRCTHPREDGFGACYAIATQRIIKEKLITHRCPNHLVSKLEAKRNGWRLFDMKD